MLTIRENLKEPIQHTQNCPKDPACSLQLRTDSALFPARLPPPNRSSRSQVGHTRIPRAAGASAPEACPELPSPGPNC